jgi:predicted dehydrogenase/nucleoside-diphosphate-sugar epimerase
MNSAATDLLASRSFVSNVLGQRPSSTKQDTRQITALRRVAIVGAGYISHVHAEALKKLPNVRLTAVVDPSATAAQAFVKRWGADRAFSSVEDLIADGAFDCAHVLVPPAVHAPVGIQLLEAGKPVLIEKPMAPSIADCDALIAASMQSSSLLGVNHNLIYHPTFMRLLRAVKANSLGPPRSVSCIYRVPLRQLSAGQFGHWMFDTPVNMLLEQAVHPLSQLAVLGGPIETVRALAGRPTEMGSGRQLYSQVDVVLTNRRLPCQFHFSVGQSFPFWQLTVTCDDGVLVADMTANRLVAHSRTRWFDPLDLAVSGTLTAAQLIQESWRNARRYVYSATGLGSRNDAFFDGMAGSIAEFHHALDNGTAPQADGHFARALVDACHRIADDAIGTTTQRLATPARARAAGGKCDVAIIGGTGFIGTHVVRRFLCEGLKLSVMARNTRNLPELFDHPSVTLLQGDSTNAEAVSKALKGAPIVINLAHGGGGGSAEEVATRMLASAETVARACLAHDTRRLIHIGSTASLYLGSPSQKVTGETAPDRRFASRGDYARAKAMTDQLLLDMASNEDLPVCILRPSIVVGSGASPFHSGFGFYNNEQHCIGWNRGGNRLPLVLVEDVAEAVWLASQADVVGRCYNLAGDVRPTAREFIAMLARAQHRPLHFHPQRPVVLWFAETGKWLVKFGAGRRLPRPHYRDILSRGMRATIDSTDAKRDLGWRPVSSPSVFYQSAVLAHGR